MNDIDILSGQQLSTMYVQNIEECWANCAENEKCFGFVFGTNQHSNPDVQGKCHLKDKGVKDNEGLVSALKSCYRVWRKYGTLL